jgi:hypothetical protein
MARRKIKIQVGVGGTAELRRFIEAGADELYGGLSSVPSHVYGADNFSSPGELLRAAAEARAAGRKFFFAANEVDGRLLEHTARVIKGLGKGVDGVIVKDLALLRRLAELKVEGFYILSTLACCYNSRTLGIYRRLGVRRLALPEHLAPAEAAGMMRGGVGTEIFIKAREYCVNANGLCFLQFGPENRCYCRDDFRSGGRPFRMPAPSAAEQFGQLYDLVGLGARFLKVGRSPRPEAASLIFREARALRDLLEAGGSRASFVNKALLLHSAVDKGFGFLRGEGRA